MTEDRPRIPVAKLLYRFATGLHMDGKRRKNPATGKVSPIYRNYYWNRIGRGRRASWRLGISVAGIAIAYGLLASRSLTEYCLLATLPFIAAWIARKISLNLFQRMRHIADDGVEEIFWSLRPKWFRRLERVRRMRIKLRPPTEAPIPQDWQRPILAQLGDEGISDVRQLRRPLTPAIPLDELLKQNPPKDSRHKTHTRNAGRRLKK